MGLALALVGSSGVVRADDPPDLKADLTALAGQWRRPADKGPDWVRLEFRNPQKSEFTFEVSVSSEPKAEKPLQVFGSAAVLQAEKTKRFIDYGDDDGQITYRLKDNKLILEGKYTNGSFPREVIDLSGEWVRADPPKKDPKKK
jgi:hypothetical protein